MRDKPVWWEVVRGFISCLNAGVYGGPHTRLLKIETSRPDGRNVAEGLSNYTIVTVTLRVST